MYGQMIVSHVILTLSHLSELIALEEQISVTIIFKYLFIFLFRIEWNNDIIGGGVTTCWVSS